MLRPPFFLMFDHLVGQYESDASLLKEGKYSISYTHSFTLKVT